MLSPARNSGGSTFTTTRRPSSHLLGDEHAAHAAAGELTLDAERSA